MWALTLVDGRSPSLAIGQRQVSHLSLTSHAATWGPRILQRNGVRLESLCRLLFGEGTDVVLWIYLSLSATSKGPPRISRPKAEELRGDALSN